MCDNEVPGDAVAGLWLGEVVMLERSLPMPSLPAKRRRRRVAGAVLWTCVGLALLGLWVTRKTNDAAAQTEQPNAEPTQVIKVQPQADGTIRIQDILQGTPADVAKPTPPTWDSAGVEDFTLTNCDGRTMTKQDLLGKPWVVSFIFTRCLGPCPVITQRVRDLQTRFKDDDVQFVTLGVDPDRDSPADLKQYAELNGADLSRWYFLHGDANAIYGLIHRSFQMPVRMPDVVTGNYQVEHSQNILLVNADGVVQGKYLGTKDEDLAKLARDIRRLLHPTTASVTPAPTEMPAAAWYMRLPAVNASLNALATALLLLGYVLIKQRRPLAHRNVMLATFGVSIAFLACYLVYHAALHQDTGLAGKKFMGEGPVRIVYFSILISHVLLATAVPVLALVTIYRGLKADWPRHRKIAKITYPIWMYVSVTGVIIYLMLYHWPTGG